MNERITLLGGSGYVGRFISTNFRNGRLIDTPSSSEFNLLDTLPTLVKWIERNNPDVVINCAAETKVDNADPDLCYTKNVEGVRKAAIAAQQNGKHFIHISTDMVFPGSEEFPGPYSEDMKIPQELHGQLGVYAYSKLLGEEAVMDVGGSYSIVRISLPYGDPTSPRDFAVKLVKAVIAGYPIFTDQIITPTYLPDLALVLSVISEERLTGIFHCASQNQTTPFEFANEIIQRLNLPLSVKQGSIYDFLAMPGVTPRLVKGGLTVSQTNKRINQQQQTIEDALEEYIPALRVGLTQQGII